MRRFGVRNMEPPLWRDVHRVGRKGMRPETTRRNQVVPGPLLEVRQDGLHSYNADLTLKAISGRNRRR